MRGQPDSVATVLGGRAYEFKYGYRVNGLPQTVTPTGTGATFVTRTYNYHSKHWSLTGISLAAKTTTIAHDDELMANTVSYPGGDKVASSHTSSHRTSRRNTTASYSQTVWRAIEQDAFGRIHRHQALEQVEGRMGSRFVYDSLGRVVRDSLQWRADGETPIEHWTEVEPGVWVQECTGETAGAVVIVGYGVQGSSSTQWPSGYGSFVSNRGYYHHGPAHAPDHVAARRVAQVDERGARRRYGLGVETASREAVFRPRVDCGRSALGSG